MSTETTYQILLAIGDPTTLLSILTFGLGLILLGTTWKIKAFYKGVPIKMIAALTVAVALSSTVVNIVRLLPGKTAVAIPQPPKKTSTLQVTFYGTKSRIDSVTVPFRVSSGQINVGCGDVRGTQAVYTAPLGARNISAVPSWENIRDVKQQDKSLVVQGTVVTASGQLVGNNREWTGNCPGGGHGELVITGTYVIDQSATPEQVVLSTFQGFVQPNSSVQVPIPPIPSLPGNMTSEVLVANAEGLTSKVNLMVSINAAGVATGVVQPQPAASGVTPALIAARVDGKNLTIDVR